MKKAFIILSVCFTQFSLRSQTIFKTAIPCSDSVLFNTPGRWFKGTNVWQTDHIAFNRAQQQEVLARMDSVHKMMLNIYRQPLGVDVAWNHTLGYSTFGDQVTYVRTDQFTLDRKTLVEKPVASFGYVAGFFRHFCGKHENEIWAGYPGETGTFIRVFANAFAGFATEYFGNEDSFTVGGYPVHLRQPLKQNFHGYELFYSKAVVNNPELSPERFVLVHRKGELPYIPVTRKQYLERCIPHLGKWHDRLIKMLEQQPMRTLAEQEAEKQETLDKMKKDFGSNPAAFKSAVDYYLSGYKTEQQTRKEQVSALIKQKDAVIKHYRDELEETTRRGLLDSAAIIPFTIYHNDEHDPIFVEEKMGWMITTANPKYMRKELPKHIPQFFVVAWQWNDWKSQADVAKLIEEKFPFDKLHAMIDK